MRKFLRRKKKKQKQALFEAVGKEKHQLPESVFLLRETKP